MTSVFMYQIIIIINTSIFIILKYKYNKTRTVDNFVIVYNIVYHHKVAHIENNQYKF